MTAKRFTYYKCEILDDGKHFAYAYSEYNAEDICKKLNEQHETIQRLKQNIDELLSVDVEEELLKENEQLKESVYSWSKSYNRVYEEKEQLKTIIDQLRTDNTKQKKKLNTTMKENEQLKKHIEEHSIDERLLDDLYFNQVGGI